MLTIFKHIKHIFLSSIRILPISWGIVTDRDIYAASVNVSFTDNIKRTSNTSNKFEQLANNANVLDNSKNFHR